MALQLQRFTAKICGDWLCGCFKFSECPFGKLSHSLFMLSCQHTLNVKELVWENEFQGCGWIIDTHATCLLLVLSLFVFVSHVADRCPSQCFYGDWSQHKACLSFSSWRQSLACKSSVSLVMSDSYL